MSEGNPHTFIPWNLRTYLSLHWYFCSNIHVRVKMMSLSFLRPLLLPFREPCHTNYLLSLSFLSRWLFLGSIKASPILKKKSNLTWCHMPHELVVPFISSFLPHVLNKFSILIVSISSPLSHSWVQSILTKIKESITIMSLMPLVAFLSSTAVSDNVDYSHLKYLSFGHHHQLFGIWYCSYFFLSSTSSLLWWPWLHFLIHKFWRTHSSTLYSLLFICSLGDIIQSLF